MAISVKITGVQEVVNLFTNLPIKLEREINKDSLVFLKRVKKSAKLRAPRDTGRMANSINISAGLNKNSYVLQVDSPYAQFQEFGFKPHFFITDPGRPGFQTNKLPLGQVVFVKKFTPFIQPALQANITQLSNLLAQGTKRAINASM